MAIIEGLKKEIIEFLATKLECPINSIYKNLKKWKNQVD